MFRLTSCLAVLVVVANTSQAVELFSVNTSTDELVSIDISTGTVTTVGMIGHEMHQTDLTSLGGLLYAITSNSSDQFSGTGYSLVTIDPTTGSSISSVNMTFDGGNVHAESITTAGETLIIGYDHASLLSKRTAEVSPVTGIVTNSQFHGVDIDALGTTLGGQMFGLDGSSGSPSNHFTFFTVERDPPGGAFIGGVSFAGGMSDLAFAPVGAFALDEVNSQLLQLDLSGSPTIVDTIPLSTGLTSYRGLAYIPEPSTIILLLTGALGLLAYRIRRR